MKSIRFSLLTVALWSTFTCIPEMARGQFELAIRLDYRVYLRFEPIIARTEVNSRIGQPVVFNAGGNNPRFYYEVRDVDGHVLSPLPELAPPPPVLAAAQDDLIFTNDMTRLFAMRDPGQYSIQPCIDWMGKTYRGDKQHLEVVAGREVSRITGVVPDDGTTRTGGEALRCQPLAVDPRPDQSARHRYRGSRRRRQFSQGPTSRRGSLGPGKPG